MHQFAVEPEAFPQTVLWTRGDGCRDLAEALAGSRAIQAQGDPREACIEHRADMLVMAQVGSLDILPVAAPSGFDPAAVGRVVAAVAEGPHSTLAAVIAARIADQLAVPVSALIAVRPGAPRAEARGILNRACAPAGIDGEVVETDGAKGLIEELDSDTLVVLGAPGGNWLQRQFFGPGARLIAHAPAGTIVVRDAPLRAFQLMSDPAGLSPHLRVGDATALMRHEVEPVVDEGKLVGVIRRSALATLGEDGDLGAVMEEPVYASATEPIEDLAPLTDFYDHSPIPLVDRKGRLVGLVDWSAIPPRS